MKIEQLNNKNQFVIYGNGTATFQSYDSTIAIIDSNKRTLTLGRRWDYSKTTSKHLYLFLAQEVGYNGVHEVHVALSKPNKRAAIQKLIDTKVIEYDENLI